jgi:hypothetical protein
LPVNPALSGIPTALQGASYSLAGAALAFTDPAAVVLR